MRRPPNLLVICLASIGCVNEPPGPPLFHIEPRAPTTEDTLTVVLDAPSGDLESDDVAYDYQWSVNGIDMDDLTSAEVGPDSTARGQSWRVDVTARDRRGSSPSFHDAVTIVNAAPEFSEVAISPASPRSDEALTCTWQTSDADGDTLTPSVTWEIEGADVAGGSELAPGEAARDQHVACRVLVSDGHATSTGTSETTTIRDTPPSLDGISFSGVASRAEDLVAIGDTSDYDDDTVVVRWEWYLDETVAGEGDRLAATAMTRGQEVRVVGTPDDGALEGDPLESATLIVGDAPPSAGTVGISPSVAYTNDTLTAVVTGTTDGDGDAVGLSYTWTVDGRAAGTASTLAGTQFSKGDAVVLAVRPNDGEMDGPVATASITVLNTPPTATGASLSTSSVDVTGSVTCTGTGFADDDGDKGSFRYQWYVEGSAGPTSAAIDGGSFARGDEILCVATPWDGEDAGPSVSSAALIVGDAAPSAPEISISPSSGSVGDVFTCAVDVDSADPDGDTVSYSYEWTQDGAVVSTSSTYTSTDGGTLTCTVTPSDGTLDGAPATAMASVRDMAGSSAIASVADIVLDFSTSTTPPGTGPMAMGDVDGDGNDDLGLGAELNGYVTIYRGPIVSASPPSPYATLKGSSSYYTGRDFALADLDSDGKADAVVGSPYEGSTSKQGIVWFVYDPSGTVSLSTLTSTPAVPVKGDGVGSTFGDRVENVGDVDGDGIDDIVVGEPYAGGTTGSGRAYLFEGGSKLSGSGLTTSVADAKFTTTKSGGYFGGILKKVGDLNEDGLDDIALGADAESGGGALYLFDTPPSSSTVAATSAYAKITGPSGAGITNQTFAAGDVDGDGHLDLAIPDTDYSTGTAWIALGGFSGTISLPTATGTTITSTSGTYHAWLVDLGDFDGDGYADLLTGSPYVGTPSLSGEVYLFYGVAGPAWTSFASADATFTNPTTSGLLGYGAGYLDVNQDGASDIVVTQKSIYYVVLGTP